MDEEKIKRIYSILNNINITAKNEELVDEIRNNLLNEDYIEALKKLEKLNNMEKIIASEQELADNEEIEEQTGVYPKKLSDAKLEETFIGLLLKDPKLIVKYYFLFDECYFEDEEMLNI